MKKLITLSFLFCALLCNAQDKLSQLRTSKQITTIEVVTEPYYTVQILALRLPPSDAAFFRNVSNVKEYRCTDGYVRYTVGSYATFAEANAALGSVREDGYKEAFVANTKRFNMAESEFTGSTQQVKISPNRDYVVQLGAFRYPLYLTFFENVDEVYEYRMNDKIFRYTTAPVRGSEVRDLLKQMQGLGYKNAFIVDYEKYQPYKIE